MEGSNSAPRFCLFHKSKTIDRGFLFTVIIPSILAFVIISAIAGITISISVYDDWLTIQESWDDMLLLISRDTQFQYGAAVNTVSVLNRMVSAWRDLSPDAFVAVTQPLTGMYGFAGCAYGVKVLDADRSAFEAALSLTFNRSISITNPLNFTQVEGHNPVYYPVIRQSSKNSPVIGSDTWALQARREAILRSAAQTTPQISTPNSLNVDSNINVVLVAAAIYDCPNWSTDPLSCGPSPNVAARANQTVGFNACAVGFGDLSKTIVDKTMQEYEDIVDVSMCIGNSLLYSTNPDIRCTGRISSTFTLGGQNFTQYISPKNHVLVTHLGTSVIGSIVLFAILVVVVPPLLFLYLRDRRRQSKQAIEQGRNEERERGKMIAAAMKTLLQCTSHDMRAPLQACINAVGLLKDELRGHSSALTATLMDVVMGATSFLQALIDNILETQKIESSTLELVESPTNIAPKLRNLVGIIEAAALFPDEVSFTANIDDIPMVMCDSGKVQRMVLNLVSNAAKFTKKGSITVDFRLGPNSDSNKVHVHVQVKDTGCGMTEEQISKLGTPYVHSSATKGGGSGLGIYICKSYAEMYGGVFNVQSTVGQGTTISFTLTFNKVIQQQVDSTPPAHNKDHSSSGPQATAAETPDTVDANDRRQLKVLYCEDHPVTRKVMAMMLEKMGCSVEVAVDGLEASQKIVEGGPYDVVFMDMQMPHKNGDEVVREFRTWESSQSNRKKTPIVALTGNVGAEDIASAKEAGCDLHLGKPTKKEDLQQILNAIRRRGLSDLTITKTTVPYAPVDWPTPHDHGDDGDKNRTDFNAATWEFPSGKLPNFDHPARHYDIVV